MILHPALAALGAENKVFVAPMTGITDRPFRRAVRRFGAGMVYSEMLASRIEVESLRGSTKASHSYADEEPMGVQLAGCEPEVIAEAARISVDRGARLIDLNFGCPVKKVVTKMGGSALMRDEKLAAAIMETVVRAIPDTPVTVKMRLGWDDSTRNATTLARMAQACGIRAITVHGRTRMQMYSGTADWQAVRAIKDVVALPVIVNGDITDGLSAQMALKQSGADAVMIGRGAQGRPWIASEIATHLQGAIPSAPPQGTNLLNVILQHYEELLGHMGTHLGMLNGRKHIGWYLKDMPGNTDLRAAINTQGDPEQVMTLLRDYFAGLDDQPPPSAR